MSITVIVCCPGAFFAMFCIVQTLQARPDEAVILEKIKRQILLELGIGSSNIRQHAPSTTEVNDDMQHDLQRRFDEISEQENSESKLEEIYRLGDRAMNLGSFCGNLGFTESNARHFGHSHRHESANLAHFTYNFSTPLRGTLKEATLHIHEDWVPEPDLDNAEIVFLVCSENVEGVFSLEERQLHAGDFRAAYVPDNPYYSVSVSDLLHGKDLGTVRFALVLHGRGFQRMSKPQNFRPYVHLKIIRLVRSSRDTKRCTEVTNTGCCLDTIEVDLSALTNQLIQRPKRYNVSYCRGNCTFALQQSKNAQDAAKLFVDQKDYTRPLYGELCCVATKYKPVTITRRSAGRERVIEVLRNWDVEECQCLY